MIAHDGPTSLGRALSGRDGVSTNAGRHRVGRPAQMRIAGLLAVVLVAVVAIVAAVAWLTRSEPAGDASTSVPGVEADAVDWIRSNIPGDTRLLTDGTAVPPGYSGSPLDRLDRDWHSFDYLLTAPGLDAPSDAAVAPVWQSSVPVAVFPTVQVRRILQTSLAETLRSREADRADRLVAGSALLSNSNVTASPQTQAGLAAGVLDLRAEATLTALAGAMPVYLANVEDVKAETAAGMPARAMTVQVTNAGKADTVISGMTAAFRPERVTSTPEGIFLLRWPLRFAPLPSIN